MFTEKRVLVTGAAGALGHAVTHFFMDKGASLVCVDISTEVLDRAFGDVMGQTEHRFLACDLTSREDCLALGTEIGSVDVLANIAGGFLMGEPVHETSDDTWSFLFDLNARSIMNTAAAMVPAMMEKGGGKIINVSARASTRGVATMGAYTASKAAVTRLTESMALELRDKGINVNCILPGTIDTKRNREDMPGADHASWVSPEDIARVIGFLASDEARAVHGASIAVDGLS